MASAKKLPRQVKLAATVEDHEKALGGGLLYDPAKCAASLAPFGLGPEHCTNADFLRVLAAVTRMQRAGAPLDPDAVRKEAAIADLAASHLIDAACMPSGAAYHAREIVLAYQKRQLQNALEVADSLDSLRQMAARVLADLPVSDRSSAQLTPLADLPDPLAEENNPAALFKNGWLRKGGGAFLIAPSGVGKSVFTIQASTLWALGLPAFGIEPVRPLRIAIVQAEDDAEELAFFRNHIRNGLVTYAGCDSGDVQRAMTEGVTTTELVGAFGASFLTRLGEIIEANPGLDLLIVNPFQSYFGGDIAHNSEVTEFLRSGLDPLLKPGRIGIFFVNHTTKPPNAKERRGWGSDTFASYVGAGGAELVNWARAVLALMPVEDVPGVFRLVASKRGQRLGWKDDTGARTTQRLIAHHEPPLVFWRDATAEETAAASGSVTASLKSFDPVKDAEKLAEALREASMQSPDLRDYAEETFGRDRGRKAYKYLTEHLKGFMLSSSKAKHKGALFFGTLPAAEAAARKWDAEKGVS